MSRSKSNSDFGELILWGFVGYGLYKIFGKNEPLVGQEISNTTNDIYNRIDWKQGQNETNAVYLQRTANEMRNLNDKKIFASQDELEQYIAYTAKVWGEKFKGKVSYAWKYQFMNLDGGFSASSDSTGKKAIMDCTNFVAGVLYSSGAIKNEIVIFKNQKQPAQNFSTDAFMSDYGKKNYSIEKNLPFKDYPGVVARLKNSDLIFETIDTPSVGNVVAQHAYNEKNQLYAKHAFILHGKYYDDRLKQNMYQVAEMLNGPSLNRIYSEKQLRDKSIHTILRVAFSR